MTRMRTMRLLALGGLALALGCRSHPKCPECHTPLFPEDVLAQAASTPTVPPASGAQLAKAEGGILPPAQLTELPDVKQPGMHLANPSLDGASVMPPPDVAPLLNDPATAMPGPSPQVVTGPGEAPKPGPDGFAPASAIGLPAPTPNVDAPPPVKDTRPPLPLKPGERFGHAPDYRWVAGILDKHQKGGYWTVRYASSDEDDPWGGKVRLLDDDKLSGFMSGDVIYVEGDVLAPRSAAETATFPPYHVTDVRLIEKAK